jgi:hypothetical protein
MRRHHPVPDFLSELEETTMSSTNMRGAASAPAPAPPPTGRLYLGIGVFAFGWILALALVPVVNGSDLSTSLKATLNTVLIVGCPKIFLLGAIAIMGKPGFAYLKSIIARKLAPPATVSVARYRIGLILLITPILLSSIADYLSLQLLPVRQEHPYLLAMMGDALIVIGLFALGGDFWDKLRALFVRDAKAVFPSDIASAE